MGAIPPPSREEVYDHLMAVLTDAITREAVADWANQWVLQDFPDVDDEPVWRALLHLSAVSELVAPGEYFHGDDDIHRWLDEFETAMDQGQR